MKVPFHGIPHCTVYQMFVHLLALFLAQGLSKELVQLLEHVLAHEVMHLLASRQGKHDMWSFSTRSV